MSEIQYPAHPGECLRDTLAASGMTQNEIAAKLKMDRNSLRRLLTGRASITPRSALALEAIGWSTAEHWMRLQATFDLARARRAAFRPSRALFRFLESQDE